MEQSYRQQIAELQDQNERKDLRIQLLEQKLQKLQVSLIIHRLQTFTSFLLFRKLYSIEIEFGLKMIKCVFFSVNN